MGVYIYSLRKESREVLDMGITPVRVIAMKFAYKEFGGWDASRHYKMLVARTETNAERAWHHHTDASRVEHGTTDVKNYIAWGGFEEGNTVFETDPGYLPDVVNDTETLKGCKAVGRLFKIGRKWSIEKECPGHEWRYHTKEKPIGLGDFRHGLFEKKPAPYLPARACNRCGKFEYADPELRAAHEEWKRENALKGKEAA